MFRVYNKEKMSWLNKSDDMFRSTADQWEPEKDHTFDEYFRGNPPPANDSDFMIGANQWLKTSVNMLPDDTQFAPYFYGASNTDPHSKFLTAPPLQTTEPAEQDIHATATVFQMAMKNYCRNKKAWSGWDQGFRDMFIVCALQDRTLEKHVENFFLAVKGLRTYNALQPENSNSVELMDIVSFYLIPRLNLGSLLNNKGCRFFDG
jgi:hypothetical protein